MSGGWDMPYEPVPDGPVEVDATVLPVAGVLVRSATIDGPTPGEKVPALLFDFESATGGALPTIALILDVDHMLSVPDLVRQAVRDAVRVARKARPS